MNTTSEVVRVQQAFAWVERGQAIHLKAVAEGGTAVALTAEETRTLAERLLKLADTLDSLRSAADEAAD